MALTAGWVSSAVPERKIAILSELLRVALRSNTSLSRSLTDLSGGERQRALLAQALVQDAPTLLLDEPITGLDLASQKRILDVVDDEASAGRTVVMSTHHLDEARHVSTVVLLANRLVACGPPAEVLTEANLRAAYGSRVLGGTTILDDHGHSH